METSGTDILNDSDVRAPVSPLHLAVSRVECIPLTTALPSVSIIYDNLYLVNKSPRHTMVTTMRWRFWYSLCWILM